MTELVASMPADLPQGFVAVIPPEIMSSRTVDTAVSITWATAFAEKLQKARPEVLLANRDRLTDILREQKFAESPYANRKTAAEIGQLASARVLLLTRLHEFSLRDGRVRVNLEAKLVDVQTGREIWNRTWHRGIFPFWAKVVVGLVIAVLLLVGWRLWDYRRRVALVTEKLPDAKSDARVDVDGVVRAVSAARDRLVSSGNTEAAARLQRGWNELDGQLERLRHALPGGAIDRSKVRDLQGAVSEVEKMDRLTQHVRSACDRMSADSPSADSLAQTLSSASRDLAGMLDAYRRYMP